jgi:hypothetical protein
MLILYRFAFRRDFAELSGGLTVRSAMARLRARLGRSSG